MLELTPHGKLIALHCWPVSSTGNAADLDTLACYVTGGCEFKSTCDIKYFNTFCKHL